MFTGKADAADVVPHRVARGRRPGRREAAGGSRPPSASNPSDGVLLGPGVTIDPKTQIEAKGAQARRRRAAGSRCRSSFRRPRASSRWPCKPPAGRWDLRDATEVRVKLKNEGPAPVTPSVQVTSNGGADRPGTAAAPLAAGEEQEIVVSFIPAVPGKGVPVPKAGYYRQPAGHRDQLRQRCRRRRQDHGQARRRGDAAGRSRSRPRRRRRCCPTGSASGRRSRATGSRPSTKNSTARPSTRRSGTSTAPTIGTGPATGPRTT